MELARTVIIFVGFLVAVCLGLPASIKDEVEGVQPIQTYGDQPIVDVGYFSGWDNPFAGNPFGGLFDSLESVVNNMRQQIDALINKFPTKGTNSSDETQSFPGLFNGVDIPAFPNIDEIDLSKGNTTSVTKVIDGHKVVINETEYKNQDELGGTFVKVRIIDVKPDSSELTTEKEAESVPENRAGDNRDREEIENSVENEISKSKETAKSLNSDNHDNISLYDNIEKIEKDEFDDIETFEEVDSMPSIVQYQGSTPFDSVGTRFSTNTNSEWFEEEKSPNIVDTEWSNVGPVASVNSNAIDFGEIFNQHEGQLPVDLSRDTYINKILAKNGAPVNPDAEIFFVDQSPGKIIRNEELIDPR